ncbi:hypothetical protein ACKWTF_015837 [Chironomus riparius]
MGCLMCSLKAKTFIIFLIVLYSTELFTFCHWSALYYCFGRNMKVALFLVKFSTIFQFISSVSTDYVLIKSTVHQKLPKSICKITNDIMNTNMDTQDILIGNLGGKAWSTTIDETIKCIDDKAGVFITDFKTKIIAERFKKSPVVILVGFDNNSHVSIVRLIHIKEVTTILGLRIFIIDYLHEDIVTQSTAIHFHSYG